ncbi:hypothetical protein DL764_000424 [Monosporascus ibericus]|uniref:O-methyltransferase domain-containing protein n=1 Tax=Monosporascus ibericus TaxID=155417 RepID=A0A4Q4TV99_9PEZI|nr:hypothetical protein DL764_000424 [Monosporascus ibericus]
MTSFVRFPNRPAVSATRITLNGAYDWSSLGSGLVIDFGGSRSTDAVNIATQNPALRILLQDLPKQLVGAEALLPEDLRASGRVS